MFDRVHCGALTLWRKTDNADAVEMFRFCIDAFVDRARKQQNQMKRTSRSRKLPCKVQKLEPLTCHFDLQGP